MVDAGGGDADFRDAIEWFAAAGFQHVGIGSGIDTDRGIGGAAGWAAGGHIDCLSGSDRAEAEVIDICGRGKCACDGAELAGTAGTESERVRAGNAAIVLAFHLEGWVGRDHIEAVFAFIAVPDRDAERVETGGWQCERRELGEAIFRGVEAAEEGTIRAVEIEAAARSAGVAEVGRGDGEELSGGGFEGPEIHIPASVREIREEAAPACHGEAGGGFCEGKARAGGGRIIAAVFDEEARNGRDGEAAHKGSVHGISGPVAQGGSHREARGAVLQRSIGDPERGAQAAAVGIRSEGIGEVVRAIEEAVGSGLPEIVISGGVDRTGFQFLREREGESVDESRGFRGLCRERGGRDGWWNGIGGFAVEEVDRAQAAAGSRGRDACEVLTGGACGDFVGCRGGAGSDHSSGGIEDGDGGFQRAAVRLREGERDDGSLALGAETEKVASAIVAGGVAPDGGHLASRATAADRESIGVARAVIAFRFPLARRAEQADAEAVFAFVIVVLDDLHDIAPADREGDGRQFATPVAVAIEAGHERAVRAEEVVAEAASRDIAGGFGCDADEVARFAREAPEVVIPSGGRLIRELAAGEALGKAAVSWADGELVRGVSGEDGDGGIVVIDRGEVGSAIEIEVGGGHGDGIAIDGIGEWFAERAVAAAGHDEEPGTVVAGDGEVCEGIAIEVRRDDVVVTRVDGADGDGRREVARAAAGEVADVCCIDAGRDCVEVAIAVEVGEGHFVGTAGATGGKADMGRESARAISGEQAERVAVAVGDGEVWNAIAGEVAHGDAGRSAADWERGLGGEGAIAIAEQDTDIVAGFVGDGGVAFAIAIEVGQHDPARGRTCGVADRCGEGTVPIAEEDAQGIRSTDRDGEVGE